MSVNRLIWGLPPKQPCRCCRLKRKLRRIGREAVALEKIAGVFEFCLPSVDALARGKKSVRMFVDLSVDEAKLGDDLRAYAIGELRKLVGVISGAADRLEGPVSA